MVRYGEFVKELAEREGATVADLNTGVTEAVRKANEKDHDLAIKLNPDRVHPSAAGQLLMAAELLKAWNAPSVVSVVEITTGSKKASEAGPASWDFSSKSQGTKLADTEAREGLKWTQLDEALPMPVDLKDPAIALAVNSSDFMDALNRQILKVSGLEGNEYTLKINGEPVGKFSRENLEEGVNLAMLPTPMMKQAQQVHKLTLQHNDIHFARWRQVQLKVSSDLPNLQRSLEALDALEQDIVKEQRAAARPKPHRYELTVAQ